MSNQINIEEISNGVHCVSWTTDIAKWDGEATKDFKLNSFTNCITDFKMFWSYCTVDYYRWSQYSMTGKYITLCLKEIEETLATTNEEISNSCGEKEIIPDYYREPHAVWVTCDGGQFRPASTKIVLKKAAPFKDSNVRQWQSTQKFFTPTSRVFTFKFFIQFNTFGISEMNAITHMSKYLFLEQKHCDVQFCFPDAQNIGGHVSILAARSPVFAAMFNHDMQESKTGQVVITDIKRDVFYQLLHYLYSGRTSTLMTEDIANPLYAAAHKYSLEDLQKECVRFLFSCVTETTAKDLFEMAAKYAIDDLKEECVRMLLSDIQVSNVVGMLIWSHVHSVEEVKNAALDVVAKNGKTVCLSIDYEKMMRTHPDLCLVATRHMWP
jgi:speckle-type POZ protein